MPTYEYACDACKHGFEVEQRITAPFLRDCPACGKPTLTRLVGTGNFILKGSGWYSDLYSGSGGSKEPSAETAKTSGDASPATKTETTAPTTPATSAPAAPSTAPSTASSD